MGMVWVRVRLGAVSACQGMTMVVSGMCNDVRAGSAGWVRVWVTTMGAGYDGDDDGCQQRCQWAMVCQGANAGVSMYDACAKCARRVVRRDGCGCGCGYGMVCNDGCVVRVS